MSQSSPSPVVFHAQNDRVLNLWGRGAQAHAVATHFENGWTPQSFIHGWPGRNAKTGRHHEDQDGQSTVLQEGWGTLKRCRFDDRYRNAADQIMGLKSVIPKRAIATNLGSQGTGIHTENELAQGIGTLH